MGIVKEVYEGISKEYPKEGECLLLGLLSVEQEEGLKEDCFVFIPREIKIQKIFMREETGFFEDGLEYDIEFVRGNK